MVTSPMGSFLLHLRGAMRLRDGAAWTDEQLLNDYRRRGDPAALAALVYRHGPMVWGVCRRGLRDYHAAEDAFQATFLVLARKAPAIAEPALLANWLYGVARQTALKAQATMARRRARERQVTPLPEPAAAETVGEELGPLLDEELSRLPDRYRAALVVCDLEGLPRREAARRLGVPEGTLAARVARGRKLLGRRLRRRGLALPAAALALELSRGAGAAATAAAPLVTATARALPAGAGAFPAQAVRLADQVARGLPPSGLKPLAALVLGLGLVAGAGLAAFRDAGTPGAGAPARPHGTPAPPAAAPPALTEEAKLQGTWRVVASERNGVKDFDAPARAHDRLEFAGDRVTFWARGEPQVGLCRLDTTRTPHVIHVRFGGGLSRECLYELDGNRLRVAWTKLGDRPAGFDTAAAAFLNFRYTYEKQP